MPTFCCKPRARRGTTPPYQVTARDSGAGTVVLRRSRSSSLGETSQSPSMGATRARRSHTVAYAKRGNDGGGLEFLFGAGSNQSTSDMVANRQEMLAWAREYESKGERERAQKIAAVVATRNPDEVRAVRKREISDNALLSGFRPQMEREYDRLVHEEGTPGLLDDIAQQAIANVFANADGSVNAVREGHGGFMRR